MTVLAVLLILGVILFCGKKKISKTPVISENTVVFQVLFRGVTLTSDKPIFRPMDDSFITIRNVPHKKVTILNATHAPKMMIIPNGRGGEKVVRDITTPFMYDCLVTLYDDAKLTDDGAVVGGNKLKIGLPIILEGKNYRFQGTLSNIQILSEEDASILKAEVKKQKEKQDAVSAK